MSKNGTGYAGYGGGHGPREEEREDDPVTEGEGEGEGGAIQFHADEVRAYDGEIAFDLGGGRWLTLDVGGAECVIIDRAGGYGVRYRVRVLGKPGDDPAKRRLRW